jgi:hypothetical protein
MVDWLLVGKNEVEFEDILVFIQTKGVEMNYLGIDRYINNVAFPYISFNNLEGIYDHITKVISLRSTFYGNLKDDLDNGEFLEEYENGTICDGYPAPYNVTRNTTIVYSCDKEKVTNFELFNITEYSLCQYQAQVKSKYFCASEYTKGYVEIDIQCTEV